MKSSGLAHVRNAITLVKIASTSPTTAQAASREHYL